MSHRPNHRPRRSTSRPSIGVLMNTVRRVRRSGDATWEGNSDLQKFTDDMPNYIRFEEETGNRANAVVGGTELTAVNGVGFTAGIIGNAANFVSAAGPDYMEFLEAFNNWNGDSLLNLWFETTDVTSDKIIFRQTSGAGSTFACVLNLGTGTVGCAIRNQAVQTFAVSPSVSINTEYMLSLTKEASLYEVYLNAVSQGTVALTGIFDITAAASVFGASRDVPGSPTGGYDGWIDETFAINSPQWGVDGRLTKAQHITALYANGAGVKF